MNRAFSQWDCRSELGAHFKPLYSGAPISWAFETTVGYGFFDDRNVVNGLLVPGIDFRSTDFSHQVYFEPAFKGWKNFSDDTTASVELSGKRGKGPSKRGIGFREAFYRFSGNKLQATAGLQSTVLGDFFLLDERVLGADLKYDFGKITAMGKVGTVEKDFARMGDFCGTRRFLYVAKGTRAGDNLFETNLAGAVLKWEPNKIVAACDVEDSDETTDFKSAGDEFGSAGDEFGSVGDEFGSVGDEFGSNDGKKNRLKFLNEVGLVFYEEFGTDFGETRYFYGAFAEFKTIWNINLKMQAVGQSAPNASSGGYLIETEKNFFWGSPGMSNLELGYFGKIEIDRDVFFMPSFSNLYLGESMRMDSRDIPIAFAKVKHNFPWKTKFYLQFAAFNQFEGNEISEYDFEAVVNAFSHVKIAGLFSYIKSDPLDEENTVIRAETRITF